MFAPLGRTEHGGEEMPMDANIEQHLNALDAFKDWSNYILVTTVAALGWVASVNQVALPHAAIRWVVACLGLSVVFGIFTLALIPIVAEGVKTDTATFYDVTARFNLIWNWPPEWGFKLKWVCWPQHVLFLLGIIIYTGARIRV
jgi:hypothetical protein